MATPASSISSEKLQGAEEGARKEKQPRQVVVDQEPNTDDAYDEQEHRLAHVIKGKILSGEKLTYNNRDDWLYDLELWALKNGVWYIISDDPSDIRRREKESKKSLFRAQNAAVLSSIFQGLGDDDRQTAHGYREAALLVRHLERKYKKALESRTQDYIGEFYGYKIKDQSVRTAHTELKNLARKVREYDATLGATMTPRHIFNRLVSVLPRELVTLGRILRAQEVEIEEGLAQLEETEKALDSAPRRREKVHYSRADKRPSPKSSSRSPRR